MGPNSQCTNHDLLPLHLIIPNPIFCTNHDTLSFAFAPRSHSFQTLVSLSLFLLILLQLLFLSKLNSTLSYIFLEISQKSTIDHKMHPDSKQPLCSLSLSNQSSQTVGRGIEVELSRIPMEVSNLWS